MRNYLTEEQRLEILAAWQRGADGPSIARYYGVSRNYAANLARERKILSRKQLERRFREDRLWQRAKANMALDAEK
jgi:hypothetical protein